MSKRIKKIKNITKEENEFTIEELQEELKEMVEKGLLACILNKRDIEIEPTFINSSQVIVKCPHCGKIVNVGKHNPSPGGQSP